MATNEATERDRTRTQTQPDHSGASLLEVQGLRTQLHTAHGPVYAVNGIDLELDPGVTLGLVGESGSGKSISCRSIMGTLADQRGTISGSVRFEGTELVGLPMEARKKLWGTGLAMVMQDAGTALNPVLTVERQLTEGPRIHLGLSKTEARERAIGLLSDVGIPDPQRRLKQYPHELSGGMRQRVNIAVALACGPSLLLADEPTTALDVTVQAQILDLLGDLSGQNRMSMVLVSHDLGVVAGRTDVTAVMYGGRIVEKAPTKELFAAPQMPYTRALLESMPSLTKPSHTRLRTIPGGPPDLRTPLRGCPFAPRCEFAQERCRIEEPPLTSGSSSSHQFACWYPESRRTGRVEHDLAGAGVRS